MAADCGTPHTHSQPRDLLPHSVQPQLPDVEKSTSNGISGVDTEMAEYNRGFRVRFYPQHKSSSVPLRTTSENDCADNRA